MKNIITEMRNKLDEINRFFTAEEKINEFADLETDYSK